jgi:hypothetical protein
MVNSARKTPIDRKQLYYLVFTWIVVILCSACNQSPGDTHEQAKQQDKRKNQYTSKSSSTLNKDAFPAYTDPVYKSYISPTLKALIEEKLPGWKLPSADSWEKYWFNAYKKADALIDYASGDFDGDGKADYALLLENENHAFIVWVLQSQSNGYKAIELTELTETTLPLNTGLELIDKGKLNHLNMDNGVDGIETIELKHQAIQVSFFEASAETYYWKDGKYQSVNTGD